VVVGEHLHFDVAGAHQPALEVDGGVAERRAGLGSGRAHRAGQIGWGGHHPHSLAAAAGHGLDHERITDAARCSGELGVVQLVPERRVRARNDRHARGPGRGASRGLAAHESDGTRARADEGQAGVLTRGGKPAVLGEEPVAGVHGIGTRRCGGVNQRGGAEITVARRAGADAHGLVGHADVARGTIAVGEDRHRREAEVAAGADNPHRDLAAVGDQDLLQGCTRS